MKLETPILLHDWHGSPMIKVVQEFLASEDRDDPENILLNSKFMDYEVLLASYTYEDYEGDAFVLLMRKRDGELYEVNGSHCSCYGLENQWSPEATNIEHLRHRLDKGNLGMKYVSRGTYANVFANELRTLLDQLEGVDESRRS